MQKVLSTLCTYFPLDTDQMVQAVRSGWQNIAEGSRASGTGTSSQTELRLLNVARASLEELLLDFEDVLRHRLLPQWAPSAKDGWVSDDMFTIRRMITFK